MAKGKTTKGQTVTCNILLRNLKIEQPTEPGVNSGAPEWYQASCSTCGTSRVALVTNLVISHE